MYFNGGGINNGNNSNNVYGIDGNGNGLENKK